MMVILKKPGEVREEDPSDKLFSSVGCCPSGDLKGGYFISESDRVFQIFLEDQNTFELLPR